MRAPIITAVVLAIACAAFPSPPVHYADTTAPVAVLATPPAPMPWASLSSPAVSAPPTLAAMESRAAVDSAPPQDLGSSSGGDLARAPEIRGVAAVRTAVMESLEGDLDAPHVARPVVRLERALFLTLDEEEFTIEDIDGSIVVGDAIGFDFGSGVAAYDEARGSYEVLPEHRSGFSDSLLQFSWQKHLAPGTSLVGTMAATRYQDVTVLESLSQPDVAWISVGLRFSF